MTTTTPAFLLWFKKQFKIGKMSESPTSRPHLFFPSARYSSGPVFAETATNLKGKLLEDSDAIDYVGNIYIESGEFYKCNKGAQHEFLAFYFKDRLDPERQSVLILDRVPRYELLSQPDPHNKSSLEIEMPVDINQQPESSTVPNQSRVLEFSRSVPSVTSKAVMCGIFMRHDAHAADMFFISKNNNFSDICAWREFSNYQKLETLDVPHTDLGIEQLLVLAAAVSNHHPFYNLYTHQCYWYAGIIWDVVCKLAGQTAKSIFPGKGKAQLMPFLSVAPRHDSDGSQKMLELYKSQWGQFCTEIEPKTGRGVVAITNDRNKIAAERDAALVERNTVVAEMVAERDAAIAERNDVLAEINELKKRLACMEVEAQASKAHSDSS
ncbi:hypothetical protein FRC12_003050 [Ceratobasidium sp. 428]|nr:hypothetical protein FRC12_003050 [Ceratobasidium sp. 428]